MTKRPAGRVHKWSVVYEVASCGKCRHVSGRQIRLHRAANPGGTKFEEVLPVETAERLAALILQACEEVRKDG